LFADCEVELCGTDVVVDAETTFVTLIVVVVEAFGEGMTTPVEGNETAPNEDFKVGPLGWLCGTNMTPKIPMRINERETAHHIKCAGRFPLCDITSPILV